MKKRLFKICQTAGTLLACFLLYSAFQADARPQSVLEVGQFSSAAEGGEFPEGWHLQAFNNIPRHTRYALVNDDGRVVVKAASEASASGLSRRIRIDPREYPLIEWHWKVLNIYRKGNVATKEGDDYPARLYVAFEFNPDDTGLFEKLKYEAARLFYGQYPPGRAITYIWESKLPVGNIVPNPYTDRARMIVVQSGESRLNQWIREERNIYEDYKKAFKQEPPIISGVAIMTDSDNTGESATTFYGDIRFKTTANQ